ncbi:MAG TPA: copper-containing nitrite reductase [Candidatus Paceibacterota bacterium]|nr:copper-containing nitrite reductase [Candidatus Paceibacterota bacterium]
MQLFTYTWSYFVQGAGLAIAFLFAAFFIYLALRNLKSLWMRIALVLVFIGVSLFFYIPNGLPEGVAYPLSMRTYGMGQGPVLPLTNFLAFVNGFGELERVANIARDPSDVPPPITRTEPAQVNLELTAKEVIAEMAPGVFVNYWTYNGTVPGPMFRVREGDTVTLTLHNDPTSIHHHNIDLHAVTGPGGGANATMVAPGESATFTFKALNPGLFVYHCATPNVANHMTHGMYGLILVEPEEGMSAVDREFYVMQGEYYAQGGMGRKGLQLFDAQAMLAGNPTYVTFNGKINGVGEKMQANTGETVRIYFGNGGVNLISSFHLIGEIFDRVYPEASLTAAPHTDVQTTTVPAGGATVTEFALEVPGNFVLVDHALARVDKGAWGKLIVTGEENKQVFNGVEVDGHDHAH